MAAAQPLCPVCKKAPPARDYRPFCSRRCSDVDLQGWFSGKYRVASEEPDVPVASMEDEDD